MNDNYIVYVQTDSNGVITAINSSVFLTDTTGWTQIDEGQGDKYYHAQGNYLEKGLRDSNDCYNYKLVDGIVVERTTEDKQPEIDARPPVPKSQDKRISDLEILVLQLGGVI